MKASVFDLITSWLVEMWWDRLPLLAGRISRTLSIVLADGLYLAAWPRLAAFAPPLALLAGFLAGWPQLGANWDFTQSFFVLILAVIFGFLSSHLGAMFVLGYGVAQFFVFEQTALGEPGALGELQIRVALLIAYAALAVMAVVIPFSVRLLRVQTSMPQPDRPDLRLVVESAFSGIVGAFLLFVYLQAVPLLIRPVYTWWRGSPLPGGEVSLVPDQAWLFALVALVVGLLRPIMEYAASATATETIADLVYYREQAVWPGLLDRLPAAPRLILGAAASTLFLAGLLESLLEALALFLGVMAVAAIRWLLATRGGGWSRAMEGLPIVPRLLVALAAAYFVSSRLLAHLDLERTTLPFLGVLALSMLFMVIVLPESSQGAEEEGL